MITGREPNILKCLPAEEQARITAAERRAIAKCERTEQKLFRSWLMLQKAAGRLRFVNPRTDKPSTIELGHPDFTIFIKGGRTLLVEMKVEGGELSHEQEEAILEFAQLEHPVFIAWNHVQAIHHVQLNLSVAALNLTNDTRTSQTR